MLFLWLYHACRKNAPRFVMVSDHINYLTFEDPGAVHTVRRAVKLAHAGDLYGAAETAGVDVAHASVVSDGLRRGMHFSIGADVDNDPRARPDAQNIVDAMRPDGIIRTVRFLTIEHPEKGGEWQWPFDNKEFAHVYDVVGIDQTWERYMARLLEDVEKLPGHIVGRFYAPSHLGLWPNDAALERYEDQLLDACLARGMAVEINTRPFYRDGTPEFKAKYRAVNERLMRKAKAKGVGIAIGSSAHSPKDQGGAFDVVLDMLDACDVNEIVFPVAGRLARVVLRATREHLEARKNVSESPQPGSSITGFSRAELGLPEETERAEALKSGRDAGPKKRASSPARTTKRPDAQTPPKPKSGSRRSVESAASSAKAREEKENTPAPATAPAVAPKEKPASKAAPKAPAPTAKPVKATAKPVKATAKPVKAVATPVKVAVTPVKTAVKPVKAATKATKQPAAKPAKVAAKAAKPAKVAAKATAPTKKVVATKKAVAKKTTAGKAPSARKATTKKVTAKKTASRPATKAKRVTSKSASSRKAAKPVARPAKKAGTPPNKGAAKKKKSTPKRR